jgi:hypothetical protein
MLEFKVLPSIDETLAALDSKLTSAKVVEHKIPEFDLNGEEVKNLVVAAAIMKVDEETAAKAIVESKSEGDLWQSATDFLDVVTKAGTANSQVTADRTYSSRRTSSVNSSVSSERVRIKKPKNSTANSSADAPKNPNARTANSSADRKKGGGKRHVASEEGERRYGLPIGTPLDGSHGEKPAPSKRKKDSDSDTSSSTKKGSGSDSGSSSDSSSSGSEEEEKPTPRQKEVERFHDALAESWTPSGFTWDWQDSSEFESQLLDADGNEWGILTPSKKGAIFEAPNGKKYGPFEDYAEFTEFLKKYKKHYGDKPPKPEPKLKQDIAPAEEEAKSLEGKREFSADERRKAAKDRSAMSDGSFPIKTKKDLKNAIKLAGKAKDPAKAKRHIKRRAKALGCTDLLPEGW